MSQSRTEISNRFLLSILDEVEQREARLLVWGYVDGHLSQDDLDDLIEPLFEQAITEGMEDFVGTDEIVNALLQLGLIIEVELANGSGYRSRMAETVRLLLRLRQLFPKHDRLESSWQDAATLVADFRFKRRPREYPRRDVTAQVALKRLSNDAANAAVNGALKALLMPPGEKELLLAGFQLRSTERILRGLDIRKGAHHDEALATIVSAGTGSGKTLAFYLPALTSVIRARTDPTFEGPWVKVVAIYPRTELLKDQLRELLSRSGPLNTILEKMNQPPIRVGALYGDTPNNGQNCKTWARSSAGPICPMLNCLECASPLQWLEDDRNSKIERLSCTKCSETIDSDRLGLTRDSLKSSPPDILFTTTEMLNQRLSDNSINHLFGIGPRAKRAPELMLLDEVHTYEGRYGAQVAYLLRRWRSLLRESVCCVGLSATLREATSFFSSLTGVKETYVEAISPSPDEIEVEGAEYLLALRGDPVSRTALLSTTIQSTMLLQRSLDPWRDPPSNGVFGKRSFVFTDNLDANNRLFFDLLSAEGRTSWKQPDMRRAPNGGLAVLREPRREQNLRYRYGQDWRMCEDIGHVLSNRLVIDRVSSQDRGVTQNADVVVATAALEVGMDDPDVGAVIQHKAPRGMAAFLQRKGRAGRKRGMRPWTVVVLSDYGRDRSSYQAYDQLFDPELPVRTLPLSNRYVTRMQAVFACIDMLGQQLQSFEIRGSAWLALAEPASWARSRKLQDRVKEELAFILSSPAGAKAVKRYLINALRLSSDEVDALLWEYPRPIITSALPTAKRRLDSGWSAKGNTGQDLIIRNNPLPDFIPATLFADLNLAEVTFDLQGRLWEENGEKPQLPVLSTIREFAPGRVSRRYGVHYATERYWVGPELVETIQENSVQAPYRIELSNIGKYATVGRYPYESPEGVVQQINVVRPLSLAPGVPPKAVQDSSNAKPNWHSELVPLGDPIEVQPPAGGLWPGLIPALRFYTHAQQAPIEVRRFATGSTADINLDGGIAIRFHNTFVRDGEPAALGLAFAADGVLFKVSIPPELHKTKSLDGAMWRALRTGRYLARAWDGDVLATITNPFLREWLAHVYLAAVIFESTIAKSDVREAVYAIDNGSSSLRLEEVLERLFQSTVVDEENEAGEIKGKDRLRQEIISHIRIPEVREELKKAANVLWESVDETWESWLQSTFHSTLAAAILKAIVDLCPSIDPDSLVIDLKSGPGGVSQSDDFDVWITETSPGGSGLIEEFLESYSRDPRRFFSLVRTALEQSEFELTDHQLELVLEHLVDPKGNVAIKTAVSHLREASNHEDILQAHMALRHTLSRAGVTPYHGFIVALSNRVIRPGVGSEVDSYLYDAIQKWRKEEIRLGLEIDLRLVSHWLSQTNEIDSILRSSGVPPPTDDPVASRMSAIYGLLWPRGRSIRQASLPLRSPYSQFAPAERLLAQELLTDDRFRVSVTSSNWLDEVMSALAEGLLVTLVCSESERSILAQALNEMVTNPVSAGYFRSFVRLQGIRQNKGMVEADIELPEAVQ
jgi:hypothetical protein